MKQIIDKAKTRIRLFALIGAVAVAFILGLMIDPGGGEAAREQSAVLDGHQHSDADKASVWTCSMHPQVQLPKAGKCPICFMDLIPVETGGTGEASLAPNQLKLSTAAVKLASIQTSPVVRGTTAMTLRLPGKVAYDETRVFHITAWVPGRITRLFADYTGTTVKTGQPMVELFSPELYSAQKELISARRLVDRLQPNQSGVLVSTARTTHEAARKKLLLLGMSRDQVNQIETTDTVSQYTTISAPISGIVVDKKATEGAYVSTGDRLYTVADLSHVWVTLDAYESDLPWLEIGQSAVFTSPSLPGHNFTGVVAFVNPVLDDKSRTAEVRFEIDNSDYRLKPDMFVTGVVTAGSPAMSMEMTGHNTAESPLLIPATAPLLTGERAIVYVRLSDTEEPVFEGRQVILGPRSGDYYVVHSGLSEGDQVVTNGAFKIDSELQLRARPSMMNPEGSPGSMPHHHGTPAGMVVAEHAGSSEPAAAKSTEKMSMNNHRKLDTLYTAYFAVQTALAGDDYEASRKGYENLASVTGRLFDGTAKDSSLHGLLAGEVLEWSREGSKSADIKEARDAFYHLSNAMISLHESYGHVTDQQFFLAYCPMARDNQGAYWLQTDKIVNNSYWGAAMLRCGEIKKELPPKKEDGI